jgi:phage terminase large subunit
LVKSIWDSTIKYRLDEIKEWAESGESISQVAERLNVKKTTFYDMIRRNGIRHYWNLLEDKYDTLVRPRLDDVRSLVEKEAHQYTIAQELGISENTLLRYKQKYKEFDDCFKDPLKNLRSKLKSVQVVEASGYWSGDKWYRPNVDLNERLVAQIDQRIQAQEEAQKPKDLAPYIVMPSFREAWDEEDKYTYVIKKGGRNTGKTVQEALKFIWRRMYTNTSGLVVRRFFNALRNSIFQDLVIAIKLLEVEKSWKWTEGQTGALYMKYLPTGAEIFFRGADKADRAKGIKSKLPISDLLVEEAAEFQKEDDLRTIINSVYRAKLPAGLRYRFSMLYNPPKRKTHWLNKKYNTSKPLKDTYVHHSVIWDNAYLSKQQREEIEDLRENKYLRYLWEFMGEPIGGGLVPFAKMTFRTITDAEIKTFDNIRQGLDWGYANNILACIKLHLDTTRKRIYFLDEIQGLQISNKELIEKVFEKGYDKSLIICDSASPKDITDLRDAGLDAIGAKKGQGSVEYGEKWLNDYELIFDWNRTPKCAQQFEDIDYDVDAQGNILSRLIDFDNDFIDATRYACERDMHGGAKLY